MSLAFLEQQPAESLTGYLFFLAIGCAIGLILQGIVGYLFMTLLDRAAPQFRRVEPPEKAFLVMIPIFNFYYNFVLFQGVPDTYRAQFEAAGQPREGDYGRGLGMWISTCVVLSLVPCVGGLFSLAALIMLFPYFSRTFAMSRELPPVQGPEPDPADFSDSL